MAEDRFLTRDVLRWVGACRDDLPEALARIADFILQQPEATVRASMADLATMSGSGEASIVRFCRKLGFESYSAFKISLASDIAYRNGSETRETDIGTRIVDAVRTTVDETSKADLQEVAQRLVAARHIDIFGSGVSGMVAQLYAYRLSRVGLVARAHQDAFVAEEVMGSLGERSVYLTISETGLTDLTERMLRLAGAQGAYRVAISGRRIDDLNIICEKMLVATPLAPLPERGEIAPAVSKIVLCELITEEIKKIGASIY